MVATLESTMSLADRVKEMRHAAGLSQEALARKANVGLSALRKIEQGDVDNPQWQTICPIIKAMGGSLDKAWEKQGDPPTPLKEIPRKPRK